jgi:phosphoribosyl 1,2-cyclic phosphate phosphodiesterase
MSGMKVVFLGTGTSQGVPVIACDCRVCQSADSRDKRLRSSVMLQINNLNLVIDTGPDFRQQMLREQVMHLDAVLFTHEHKDHIAGLDDVRAFNFKQNADIDIYATAAVQKAIKREFYYAFEENKYPGVPSFNLIEIDNHEFYINNIKIIPIEVLHYQMPVKAFRINDFTYITDAKTIQPAEVEKIKGTKVLVINALRRHKHISHFTLQEAIDFINIIKPEKAYLTHISHLLGTHHEVSVELPHNITLAYDGLTIEI